MANSSLQGKPPRGAAAVRLDQPATDATKSLTVCDKDSWPWLWIRSGAADLRRGQVASRCRLLWCAGSHAAARAVWCRSWRRGCGRAGVTLSWWMSRRCTSSGTKHTGVRHGKAHTVCTCVHVRARTHACMHVHMHAGKYMCVGILKHAISRNPPHICACTDTCIWLGVAHATLAWAGGGGDTLKAACTRALARQEIPVSQPQMALHLQSNPPTHLAYRPWTQHAARFNGQLQLQND
eukprot:29139-Chlamydomonas_euryale.AAC.2